MYHGDKNKSSENYFFDFVSINAENLFYILSPFIEDKIKELSQQMIEEAIKEYTPKLERQVDIDIETSINGKQIDLSEIRKELEKQIY